VSDTVLPVSVAAREALPFDLESFTASLASVDQAQLLQPAAAHNGHIPLERVTFTETAAGTWGIGPGSLPKVDLTISHSTIDAPTSQVVLMAGGDVLLEASTLTALQFQLASLTGQLDIVDSDVSAAQPAMLAAESGLTVTDSEVRVADGSVVFYGAVMSLARMSGVWGQTGG